MDGFALITDSRRRQILSLVWDRELAAGEIASHFDITFGAVSQQLKLLREAGLVDMRKDGNHRRYRVNEEGIAPYRAVLEAMWATALDNLAAAVEGDLHE
jgi:DNA-binding transcriptional ArsR family regulator